MGFSRINIKLTFLEVVSCHAPTRPDQVTDVAGSAAVFAGMRLGLGTLVGLNYDRASNLKLTRLGGQSRGAVLTDSHQAPRNHARGMAASTTRHDGVHSRQLAARIVDRTRD